MPLDLLVEIPLLHLVLHPSSYAYVHSADRKDHFGKGLGETLARHPGEAF